MFKRNRDIILKHTDNHRLIPGGLALQMIDMAADPDNGIRDHSSKFFIMFVPQLFKMILLAVGSVENFVNQRNKKLRHFLCDRPEYIIKIVLCSVVFFSLASDSGAATMSVFPM